MGKRKRDWRLTSTHQFWDQTAAGEHIVQVYDDESIFLEMLAAYTGSSINAGDAFVVVASKEHIDSLETRLWEHVVYIDSLKTCGLYLAFTTDDVLSKILVDDKLDHHKFHTFFEDNILRNLAQHRKIRVFSELATNLSKRGQGDLAMEMDKLWDKICKDQHITVLSAYSKDCFVQGDSELKRHVYNDPAKLIRATDKPLTEILYRTNKTRHSSNTDNKKDPTVTGS